MQRQISRVNKRSRGKTKSSGPVASPQQRTAWFTEARFGMFIHWGLYAIPARGEWVRNREKISIEAYQPYFDEFNPVRYDPRRWAAIAKAAGQKYVVLTAKHHDGFCLFDSKLTDYKATNTPAGRDLIRQYVDAFRAEGLKVGFYYSLLDWHHDHYPVDRHHPMREDEAMKSQKRVTARYVDYLHGQVRELLSNYGKIDIIWFDFSYDHMSGEAWRARQLMEMVRELQPGIITDNRLYAGHENPGGGAAVGDIWTPEQIIPAEGVLDERGNLRVWEACITMNDHWGYARDDKNFKSPGQIVHMLVECVSKGGNLLLNVGPTAKGEIQGEFVDCLQRVGAWIDRNGQSIYGCSRASVPKPQWGRYTQKGNTVYAHILEKPVGPIPVVGLGGKVRRARLVGDGSEVRISRPWNVAADSQDLFMSIPGATLPDELDTVVALELA